MKERTGQKKRRESCEYKKQKRMKKKCTKNIRKHKYKEREKKNE